MLPTREKCAERGPLKGCEDCESPWTAQAVLGGCNKGFTAAPRVGAWRAVLHLVTTLCSHSSALVSKQTHALALHMRDDSTG